MKYYLDSLVIEVTRKCNMACAHCLRGESQSIDIDTKYIDVLLNNVSGICNVTFSGGEPSLNVPAIEYVLERCKALQIPVGSFYVVTNGKADPTPLAIACLKWYAYCDDKEDGMCGLTMSKDMFHDYVNQDHEDLLRGLSFFNEDKFTDFNKVKIINEGRAEELGGFAKVDQASRHGDFCYEDWQDECRIESLIYLSANGDVKTDCDVAYDNDDYTIGNLRDSSLSYILEMQKIEKEGVLPF